MNRALAHAPAKAKPVASKTPGVKRDAPERVTAVPDNRIYFQLESQANKSAAADGAVAPAAAGRKAAIAGAPSDPGTGAPFRALAEDGADPMAGQVPRGLFIETLSAAIRKVADEELTATGRNSSDCPYLMHWIEYYRSRSAAQIERAILHYAQPAGSDPASLQAAVLVRVRAAVQAWVQSKGQVVQTPEGVSWLGADDKLPETDLAGMNAVHRAPDSVGDRSPTAGSDLGAIRSQLTAGHPLEAGVQSRIERRLGQSFGRVRVHTDAGAQQAAASLSARAFTVGRDIAFARGQYRPGTLDGDTLIAHELAHTAQPGWLSESQSERYADRTAAAALGLRMGAPNLTGSGGALALRRCSDPYANAPPEVRMAALIAETLDLSDGFTSPMRFDADGWLETLGKLDPAVTTRTMQLLKLRPQKDHTNYYNWFIQRMQDKLSAEDWAKASQLLAVDPLSGTEKIVLTQGGQDLLKLLSVDSPGEDFAANVLRGLKSAALSDVRAALMVLHRTADSDYGNALFRLSALMQKSATETQNREFIGILHTGGLEDALSEADPRLGVVAERETALNRTGGTSGLTDEQMVGLFASRGLETALTMLRDSEAQLIGVLNKTHGGGASDESLDADVDTAVAVVNKYFQPPLAFKPYEDFAGEVRTRLASAGRSVTDAELRSFYNRQRQIQLYRQAAARMKLLVGDLDEVQKKIRENEDWFRQTHWVEESPFFGPGPAMRQAQDLYEEGEERNALLNRIKPTEKRLLTVRDDVEKVLPLLGGMKAERLQQLVDLPGGAAEFDAILNKRLAEILSNIVDARQMLLKGDVKIWLLPPVVEATKRALGISEPADNKNQERWLKVITQSKADANADQERTKKILEILNVGGMIAAIGAAIFTGGGSIALYVGVASIGLGLADSAYGVISASRQTSQAETLYGTGMTEGMRLSDVPPDYRFLHMAWIGLGVNVILSAFFLKGMGPEILASLRGEEAAVEAQARKIVQRLRAAGANQSEEELLEATMDALRRRGFVAGGVRGGLATDVHPTRKEWVTGPGRSLEREVDQLASAPRPSGSTLTRAGAPPIAPQPGAAAVPSVYELSVPVSGGKAVTVEVRFTASPASGLPPGSHGAESGAGRLSLVNTDGKWTANVYLHEGLKPEAFPLIVGHELDEISGIVRRLPVTASSAEIAGQMEAAVFKPGAVGGVGTALTAHDEAAVEQLKKILTDLQDPTLKTAQRTIKQARLAQTLESMGLNDATDIGTRIAALRPQLPPGLIDLNELERMTIARGQLSALLKSAPLSAEAATGRAGGTIIDEDFIYHLTNTEGRTAKEFVEKGVRGGHVTPDLLAFEKANPQFAFLETTPAKPLPGRSGFHRYDQYMWNSTVSTAPPVGSPLRPGGAAFNPAEWTRSTQVKTAADDAAKMFLEMEDAFNQWRMKYPGLATSTDQWGRGLTKSGGVGSSPPALSSNGIEFSGYFTYTPGSAGAPDTFRLRTGFVDASWF